MHPTDSFPPPSWLIFPLRCFYFDVVVTILPLPRLFSKCRRNGQIELIVLTSSMQQPTKLGRFVEDVHSFLVRCSMCDVALGQLEHPLRLMTINCWRFVFWSFGLLDVQVLFSGSGLLNVRSNRRGASGKIIIDIQMRGIHFEFHTSLFYLLLLFWATGKGLRPGADRWSHIRFPNTHAHFQIACFYGSFSMQQHQQQHQGHWRFNEILCMRPVYRFSEWAICIYRWASIWIPFKYDYLLHHIENKCVFLLAPFF